MLYSEHKGKNAENKKLENIMCGHPYIDDSHLIEEAEYRSYLASLEPKEIEKPKDAVDTLVDYLIYGEDLDKDLIIQSLRVLAEEHGCNVNQRHLNEDYIRMIPKKRFVELEKNLQQAREMESKRICGYTQRIIHQICGEQELDKFELQSSLTNLVWATHCECHLDSVRGINVIRKG